MWKKYLQIINDRPTISPFDIRIDNARFIIIRLIASFKVLLGMDCELGHARCINDIVRAVIRWRKTLAHGGKSSVEKKKQERKEMKERKRKKRKNKKKKNRFHS